MTPDTDGLLDRCARCGAFAGFVFHKHNGKVAAACTEYPCGTRFFDSQYQAAIEWNREQRDYLEKMKQEKENEPEHKTC